LLFHQRGGVSLWSFVVASGLLPVCDCKSTTSSAIDQVYTKEKCNFCRFSPFPPAKMGIFFPKLGDFSPKGGGFFRRPPTSLPSPACGGPKARGDAVFARLLLSLRARCARAPPKQWLSVGCNDKKNRPSPTFSCGEVGDGLWWVASTTAQF